MKKVLLILMCFGALLSACRNDENEEPVRREATRTVIIYMSGENNLTVDRGVRYLASDLYEIILGSESLSSDQRLLVYVDSLVTNKQEASKPFIVEMRGGKTEIIHTYDADHYSCDPDVFRDALQRMISYAPAKSYGLVLWGHASGWCVSKDTIAASRTATRAYGQDNGADMSGGSLRWMNITQMARVLQGLPKLEFIFADCCNMMSAEVGYELRNVTNYVIGSPAEIPGDGAPYRLLLPILYKDGSQLCKEVIDTYYDYYLDDFQYESRLSGYSVPMSAIDTRYIEQLATATRDVIDSFADGAFNYPLMPSLEGLPFYLYYDAPVMYDLRAFVRRFATDDAFQAWDRTYQQAVPYYRMSNRWMTIYTSQNTAMYRFNLSEADESGCVSLFIPRNYLEYFGGVYSYNLTANNYGWNRVIDWTRYGWNNSATYVRP